jgi:hypothetical protein
MEAAEGILKQGTSALPTTGIRKKGICEQASHGWKKQRNGMRTSGLSWGGKEIPQVNCPPKITVQWPGKAILLLT